MIEVTLQKAHGEDPNRLLEVLLNYCQDHIGPIANKIQEDGVIVAEQFNDGSFESMLGFRGENKVTGDEWKMIKYGEKVVIETTPATHEAFIGIKFA